MGFAAGLCVMLAQIVLYLPWKAKLKKMSENNVIITRRYQSPCGEMIIGSMAQMLCLCDWVCDAERRLLIDRRLARHLGTGFEEGTSAVIEQAVKQFDEYFRNKRSVFDVPLLFAGTQFQQRVWRELLAIPYGTTISYSQLAQRLAMPYAVRAVANACGANAISVFAPCHRVVGSNGSLTGYAGGIEAKRKLLLIENTPIMIEGGKILRINNEKLMLL